MTLFTANMAKIRCEQDFKSYTLKCVAVAPFKLIMVHSVCPVAVVPVFSCISKLL